MATPPVIDFEKLLAPISTEAPCGTDLSNGSVEDKTLFRTVMALNDRSRKHEREINQGRPANADEIDWQGVRDQSVALLTNTTKDLWVVSWLIEALTRLHGFAGIRDGYRLARELCEQYWGQLGPRPDEGETAKWTLSRLAGLNGKDGEGVLIDPIRRIPMTKPSRTAAAYSLFDYQYVLQDSGESDQPTRDDFNRAVEQSGSGFYHELLEDIEGSEEEFAKFSGWLDENCGDHAPPSSNIAEALQSTKRFLREVCGNMLVEDAATEHTEAAAEAEDGTTAAAAPAARTPAGGLDRPTALKQLREVAAFFRRTEPHSPLSYHLEQTVRWAEMPLRDLIEELVPNKEARKEMFLRIGIPDKDED